MIDNLRGEKNETVASLIEMLRVRSTFVSSTDSFYKAVFSNYGWQISIIIAVFAF